jgi:hypothetical protein
LHYRRSDKFTIHLHGFVIASRYSDGLMGWYRRAKDPPRGRVLSSNDFRDFAKECLDWAKTAKSDGERDIFLQMAQSWLEAAARSERAPTELDRARQEVITRLAQ